MRPARAHERFIDLARGLEVDPLWRFRRSSHLASAADAASDGQNIATTALPG
jgi:hypothetical protein